MKRKNVISRLRNVKNTKNTHCNNEKRGCRDGGKTAVTTAVKGGGGGRRRRKERKTRLKGKLTKIPPEQASAAQLSTAKLWFISKYYNCINVWCVRRLHGRLYSNNKNIVTCVNVCTKYYYYYYYFIMPYCRASVFVCVCVCVTVTVLAAVNDFARAERGTRGLRVPSPSAPPRHHAVGHRWRQWHSDFR